MGARAARRHPAARRSSTAGWRAKTALTLASVLLCLAALELVLRAYPLLLGDTYANGTLSGYTTRPGGIFYRDPALGINFMIPKLTTQMYYNRYLWTHETDAFGFRNRNPAVPADVVLLGDSLVYGHGVDYEDTVGHLLQQRTGLAVVNLARQGDCAFQEAYLLTEYLPVFRPRWVLYHFFENDIADLRAYLSEDAMRAFIATPVSAITFPARTPVEQALAARDETLRRRSWLRQLRDTSYVYKLYRWARRGFRVDAAHAKAPRAPHESVDEERLGWQYTRHAIRYMQHVAVRQGTALAIVPLTPYTSRYRAILEQIAAELGLPVLDTRALTAADASLWLPQDGHLSARGARRLVEIEAEYLRGAESRRTADQAAGGRRPRIR
jgi:hypothetical protein